MGALRHGAPRRERQTKTSKPTSKAKGAQSFISFLERLSSLHFSLKEMKGRESGEWNGMTSGAPSSAHRCAARQGKHQQTILHEDGLWFVAALVAFFSSSLPQRVGQQSAHFIQQEKTSQSNTTHQFNQWNCLNELVNCLIELKELLFCCPSAVFIVGYRPEASLPQQQSIPSKSFWFHGVALAVFLFMKRRRDGMDWLIHKEREERVSWLIEWVGLTTHNQLPRHIN